MDENQLKYFFFHDPLVDLKKVQEGPEDMAKFLIFMWYICYCYIIAGRSLGALMYLKNKTLQNVHLTSFMQLLQNVQVSGWCFVFCIPSAICNI